MDIANECEVLRKEFNNLADRHNMLVDENKKLKIQLEYKDTIVQFIQSLKTAVPEPSPTVDEPQIVYKPPVKKVDMLFTLTRKTTRATV
jgi:hypothetical protein